MGGRGGRRGRYPQTLVSDSRPETCADVPARVRYASARHRWSGCPGVRDHALLPAHRKTARCPKRRRERYLAEFAGLDGDPCHAPAELTAGDVRIMCPPRHWRGALRGQPSYDGATRGLVVTLNGLLSL